MEAQNILDDILREDAPEGMSSRLYDFQKVGQPPSYCKLHADNRAEICSSILDLPVEAGLTRTSTSTQYRPFLLRAFKYRQQCTLLRRRKFHDLEYSSILC